MKKYNFVTEGFVKGVGKGALTGMAGGAGKK